MRITLGITLLILSLGFFTFARADVDSDTVIGLENSLAVACVAGNPVAYESALSDRFRGVNADGSVETKKPYIADLSKGIFKCSEYKQKNVACDLIEGVLIYHATVSEKATWNGTDCSGDYQLTDIWAKENGQWRCVHSQWTLISK